MPKVVEPYPPQTVLYKQLLKFLRYIIRLQQHSNIVHTDEIKEILIIAVPAELPLRLLMTLYAPKIPICILTERQTSVAVLGLGGSRRIHNRQSCRDGSYTKRRKPEIVILTRDEQFALMNASYSHRYGVFVRLVLFTGLRLGELLGLMWQDIDFAGGLLHVRRTLNRLNKIDRPDNPNESTTEIVIQSPQVGEFLPEHSPSAKRTQRPVGMA